MKQVLADVAEFHERFRVPVEDEPVIPESGRVSLRRRLHTEEFNELATEMQRVHRLSASGIVDAETLESVAKELADLIYVCAGTALELGIPLDRVWAEVHRSNMTKQADPDGGKVLKGSEYMPPNIGRALWGDKT